METKMQATQEQNQTYTTAILNASLVLLPSSAGIKPVYISPNQNR